MLEALIPNSDSKRDSKLDSKLKNAYLGIGLDACVIETKFPNIFMIQTVDFFYPLIEHPYWMGKIACANVLSDLYAMGVTSCDNMLMLLGVSTDLNETEKTFITSEMIKGFSDLATKEGDTNVNGGQTVKNPWMMIGGVATTVVSKEDFIEPWNAKEGDLIILTKPLGTQVVANAHQWLDQNTPAWSLIKDHFTREQIESMYDQAVQYMAALNRSAAILMHKYHATACTDVTGFGILGHAQNLASKQLNQVDFDIHTLPCIKYTTQIEELMNGPFGLLKGTSSETSGGLLICLSQNDAPLFINEFKEKYNSQSWIIGKVSKGNNTANIVSTPTIIQIE